VKEEEEEEEEESMTAEAGGGEGDGRRESRQNPSQLCHDRVEIQYQS